MNNITDREYFLVRSSSNPVTICLNIDFSRKYDHVAVSSASIPKTFYVLQENCTLTVNENGVIRNVTFMAGNYNVRSFSSIFVTNLSAVCSYTYTCSYPNPSTDVDTGKFTFTVSGNGGVQPTFSTLDIYLANVLGFAQAVVYPFVGNVLMSTNVINFQSFDELKIISDIVTNKSNLLQEIYINDIPYSSSLCWQNPSLEVNGKPINPLGNNTYTFTLQDSDGGLVALNGNSWSFWLCIFKVNDIDSILKQYIELMTLEMEKKSLD